MEQKEIIQKKLMIKPLTSLRFVFAFLVFMSHKNLFPHEAPGFLWHIFREGYAGVSFFFMFIGKPPCFAARSAGGRLTVPICNTGQSRWTTVIRARPPGIKTAGRAKAALPAVIPSEIPPSPADMQHAVALPFVSPYLAADGRKPSSPPIMILSSFYHKFTKLQVENYFLIVQI